jgi:IPT/TIG domain
LCPYGLPQHLGPQPLLVADGSQLVGRSVAAGVEQVSAGCCSVAVSLNGVDWTSGVGAAYHFLDAPIITSILPDNGPVQGGSKVVLSGGAFSTDVGLACVFLDVGVEKAATRLTPTSVECQTPPLGNPRTSGVGIRCVTTRTIFRRCACPRMAAASVVCSC